MRKRSIALAVSCSLLWFAGCADLPSDPRAAIVEAAIPVKVPTTQAVPTEEYRLRLHHLHTGESLDVAYRRDQQYLAGGLAMLNHLLRDHRTNEDAHYPVLEFELLHSLMIRLGKPNGIIDIVCGYRSPQSNRYLRSQGPNTGVAEDSQHILSQAVDIRVLGISTERLRDAALSLSMGGVGYYPRSGFVHVDVGPIRQWAFGSHRLLRTAHSRASGHHSSQA